jgi:hypothetical protein
MCPLACTDLAAEQEARFSEPTTDPNQYEGAAKFYLMYATRPAMALAVEGGEYEPHFSFLVISAIMVAGVLVGVSTYPTLECADWNQFLDLVVTVIFILEVFVKIAAEGMRPWKYWTGKEWAWNNFDFMIVLLCLPWGGSSCGGGSDDGGDAASMAPVLRYAPRMVTVELVVCRRPSRAYTLGIDASQ